MSIVTKTTNPDHCSNQESSGRIGKVATITMANGLGDRSKAQLWVSATKPGNLDDDCGLECCCCAAIETTMAIDRWTLERICVCSKQVRVGDREDEGR